jgi:hypothetical protein
MPKVLIIFIVSSFSWRESDLPHPERDPPAIECIAIAHGGETEAAVKDQRRLPALILQMSVRSALAIGRRVTIFNACGWRSNCGRSQ